MDDDVSNGSREGVEVVPGAPPPGLEQDMDAVGHGARNDAEGLNSKGLEVGVEAIIVLGDDGVAALILVLGLLPPIGNTPMVRRLEEEEVVGWKEEGRIEIALGNGRGLAPVFEDELEPLEEV